MAPLRLPLLLLVLLLSEVPLAASGQEENEVKDDVSYQLGPAGHRIDSVSLSASTSQEECDKDYFKDRDSPEMCQKCSSCGNLPIITECSPTNDRVCGSAGNSLPERLVLVLSLLLSLVCVLPVGLEDYFYCTKRESANEWDGPDGRNSSKMHLDSMDTENNQCKPEEKHNLLPKRNSDSIPDSATSEVPELQLQNGAPNPPPIAQ